MTNIYKTTRAKVNESERKIVAEGKGTIFPFIEREKRMKIYIFK